MIHDPKLLEALSSFAPVEYSGEVFRATRKSLDPLTGSSRDGRWHFGSECTVLYTSLSKDGAMAEISFHWSLLNPLPSKPVVLHTLNVKVENSLKLLMGDLVKLGINKMEYKSIYYQRTREIGIPLFSYYILFIMWIILIYSCRNAFTGLDCAVL